LKSVVAAAAGIMAVALARMAVVAAGLPTQTLRSRPALYIPWAIIPQGQIP